MANSTTPAFYVAQAYARLGGAFTFLGTGVLDMTGLATYTPTAREAAMYSLILIGAPSGNFDVVVPITQGMFYCVFNLTASDARIIGVSGTGATVASGAPPTVVGCDGTNWKASGGSPTLAGDANGPAGSNTVSLLHIPAGVFPPVGSGVTYLSADGTSGSAEEDMSGDNWVHLSTNAATKLNVTRTFTVPATTGNFYRLDAEVQFRQVGSATSGAAFRRTVTVINNATVLANPVGTQADADNTPQGWTPTPAIAGSVAAIVMNNGSPATLDIMGTRQAGVDTYARIVSVSFAGGSSGH